MSQTPEPSPSTPHKRRPRYSGKNPRRFEEKYKELQPEKYPDSVAKILASGKTPAGAHRSIMVAEILEVLDPKAGEFAVDCTLGYGGHAKEILAKLQPGGKLAGIDADPLEITKTETRLRALGFGPDTFAAYRSNFAGLPKILSAENRTGIDVLLADLGVSSMQIDNPSRGFSLKVDGPLDMRMNPQKGKPASKIIEEISAPDLALALKENADEPFSEELANVLAGRLFSGSQALVKAIHHKLQRIKPEEQAKSVRRVFQALRILVNEELTVLETLLRHLPGCMNPGGRIAILSFHSGEDRRVKKTFEAGFKDGIYSAISDEVLRAGPQERHDNPRSTSAKLRWAIRSAS
ncbi:MAG: 16S rRNA (cytosine(1402)-N(4))-methyltransferase RsmH [Verrucomicrobiota bacterium]